MEDNKECENTTLNPIFHKKVDDVDIVITFTADDNNAVSRETILDILFHAYEARLTNTFL